MGSGTVGTGRARRGWAWHGKARNGEAIINKEKEEMKSVTFTLKGITPLLTHNPAQMQRPAGAEVGKKVIPSAEEEAEAGTYRLPSGDLGFPAVGVRNCILRATSGYRHGKKALRPFLAGSLLPAELLFPLVNEDGEPVKEYIIDVQRAVIQRAGIMRARPRLDVPWYLACAFRFRDGLLSEEALLTALKVVLPDAGATVGIGDYRIEKSGWYGGFEWINLEVHGENDSEK